MAAPASKHRVQDFIDAIPGTAGIISTIAKKVGCSWHTAKRYIETYPTIAQAYADECAVVLDFAESDIDDLIALLWRLKYAPAKPLESDNLPDVASNGNEALA